jgi:hypothetical protein
MLKPLALCEVGAIVDAELGADPPFSFSALTVAPLSLASMAGLSPSEAGLVEYCAAAAPTAETLMSLILSEDLKTGTWRLRIRNGPGCTLYVRGPPPRAAVVDLVWPTPG